MTDLPGPIDPPARLLMGPGPISAYPSVLRAMSAPLVGQYDPFMTATMTETQELYRGVWATGNEATLLIDGTSRAGIEAAIVSLRASRRPRARAGVRPVRAPAGRDRRACHGRGAHDRGQWGQVFPASVIEEAIVRVKPTLLALVQGDTSTTMNQPLDEVGAICAKHGVLFYTDATASLGGNAVRGGRVGAGCRDRRPAEVPRRSVGVVADHACRTRAVEVVAVAHADRGGHPRGRRRRRRPTSCARTTSTSA